MTTTTTRFLLGFGVLAVLLAPAPLRLAAQQASRIAPGIYGGLQWRHIGPEGNRISAVSGVPGQPLVYYAGSASGGIHKTVDGGITWDAIFDSQSVHSIGDIAVAPSDPSTVWAGTGEACIRSHISVGEGIFKSTDAGRSWTRMGLEQTGRIGKVIVHPKNPDVVYACALGHAYGPQPERGVFRTSDGGRNWERVLFVDENTGCSELDIDPANPRKLFAGMWQIDIKTWARESGGPGSGLFTSNDGGATWTRLRGNGLPSREVGKVKVAIAPSNADRVYAMIETGDGIPWNGKETDRGQVWRSEDGGRTWRVVSYDRNAMGRAHYYSHIFVSPDNENETYFLTAGYSISLDGGQTLAPQNNVRTPGGDHHDMWIDPDDGNRMIVGHDQGFSISNNRGRSWYRNRLPNAQMYHVTVDNQIPYYVYGNKQDGPSYRGPSNSRLGGFGGGGQIPRSLWHTVAGGESGWATPDPVDPNLIWSSASGSGSVGGIVAIYEENRRQARNVEVWPEQANGVPADLRYRFNWTMPLTMSPHDRNTVYVGSQHVHRTTNRGQSWEVISPDLSTNDKARQQFSGGLTGDNIGVEYAFTVMAIAESRLERGVIWAGTNDGQVQVTRDNGKTWTNLTKNIPSLPPWGTVGNIEPSKYDAATAYLTVDLHQVNNRDPFVYKTTDYGRTWRTITNGIPRSMLSYAHCIKEDPVRRGLLYLGTENAIYVSFDDGENWQPLQTNMPHAPVYWIAVQEHFNDLVIATYGRGFWILDDLSPLQQLTPQVTSADAHLFPPRAAYRFREITGEAASFQDPTVGQNPQYGAAINYYLRTPPAGDVTVSILDDQNRVIRSLPAPKQAGLNRIHWDLRDEPSPEMRLRTSPLYAPDITVGPDGTRPGGGPRLSILMPPGAYTVRLNAGGKTLTQRLEVRKDPNSAGTDAEIREQFKMLTELRRELEVATDLANQIEIVRAQILNLDKVMNDSEIMKPARELEMKLVDLQQNLVELRTTGRGQDGVRFGARLLSKIGYLANGLASADFRPTNQQLEVQKILRDEVRKHQTALAAIVGRELKALNELMRGRGVPNIVIRAPGSSQ
ncbi:MAG: sialidase [Cyanobacteria bacterium]|nr:sialidase [Cyanobacteriota bacterium]